MRIATASAPVMKRINRATILSVIRDERSISRSQIAVHTGLTKATVTNLVSELIDEGLLREDGRAPSTGGRRPIPVVLNPEARFVLGVDVGIHEVRVMAVDLGARAIDHWRYPLGAFQYNDQFLAALGDAIDQSLQSLIGRGGLVLDQWLGIGVGMHGVVDARAGLAIAAPHLGLSHVPVRDYLAGRFGVDVFMDNDVRAMALGERWIEPSQAPSNFIFVNVGVGVGAAIVLQGELWTGATGSAGEIGHHVVEPTGRPCACGKRGCLETVCSGPSLACRAVSAIQAGARSLIADLVGQDFTQVTGQTVYQAAELGDPLAIRLFETAGRYLGQSVGQLINALDPELVVIGGGVSRAGHHLFDPLIKEVKDITWGRLAEHVQIVPAGAPDGTQMGAATMVLETLFSPEL